MFQFVYNSDVETYGSPGVTDVQVVASSTISDNTQTIVERWARQIQPSKTDKGKKRARTDEEDNENSGSSSGGGTGKIPAGDDENSDT